MGGSATAPRSYSARASLFTSRSFPCAATASPTRAGGADDGSAPALTELRLHHGTVWKWNRPVYDPAGAGNLRIELRALPSGPTVDDMLANAAFLVGAILELGSGSDLARLLPAFPFALADRNFYRAAQMGLDAELGWPFAPGEAPAPVRARDLLLSLLPRAAIGLSSAGVAPSEIRHYLGIFERRVQNGMTGAIWQLRTLEALRARGLAPDEARRRMLESYLRTRTAASRCTPGRSRSESGRDVTRRPWHPRRCSHASWTRGYRRRGPSTRAASKSSWRPNAG